MINIKKAEEEFRKYTKNYNMNESNIERKVRHAFRVEKLCEEIAILLGMNEEKVKLAKLIGLLHDIGRFEQYTRYKTYNDCISIDHGNFAVDILEEDNYVRKYIETDEYDEIIKKAIYNHNKYSIESNLTAKEKIFCKIIRDADKLDIMYEATCEFWKNNIEEIGKQIISPKVLKQFMDKQIVNKRDINYDIDRVIVVLAFIYDFNFKDSYKIIKENNYIDKIMDRFNFEKEETKNQMELARKIAKDYLYNQIQNN